MDKADDIGKKIVDGMIGHGVLEHVFRKKDQVSEKLFFFFGFIVFP